MKSKVDSFVLASLLAVITITGAVLNFVKGDIAGGVFAAVLFLLIVTTIVTAAIKRQKVKS